jgi:hypothetical protein
MSKQIKLVLPDTGPLITLAHADALDALLVFDPDHVQLVITDMVQFEATRQRTTHADAQRIVDFIQKYAGRVAIEQTSFGQMAISAAQTYEHYRDSEQVRNFYAERKMTAPAPLAHDSGELSINSYVTKLIGQPPGQPCLVIAEDDFFLRSTPGALPGNAHIISTARLLAKIEELDPRFSARKVLDAAAAFNGRNPNRAVVDEPAAKIKGGTAWGESLNASNLTKKLIQAGTSRIPGKKASDPKGQK